VFDNNFFSFNCFIYFCADCSKLKKCRVFFVSVKELESKNKELKSKDIEINALKIEIENLKSIILNRNKKIFGKSIEKFSGEQLSLFNEAVTNLKKMKGSVIAALPLWIL
jgi:hypothetical protein